MEGQFGSGFGEGEGGGSSVSSDPGAQYGTPAVEGMAPPAPEGQPGIPEGEGVPGAAPEGASAPGAAPEDPWAGQAPEFLRESIPGLNTYADLRQGMAQLQERASLADAQEKLIAQLLSGQKPGPEGAALPGVAPAQAPQKAAFDWYGMGSKEAFLAAYQANPEAIEAKRAEWAVAQAMERFKSERGSEAGAGAPSMDPRVQQMLARTQIQDVQNRYSEAADPALWQSGSALDQYVRQNPWISAMHQRDPQFNAHEVAFKLWHYDQLAKRDQAAKSKLGELRGKAGTARASIGAAGVSKGTPATQRDAVLKVIEQRRAQGLAIPRGAEEYAAGLRN